MLYWITQQLRLVSLFLAAGADFADGVIV